MTPVASIIPAAVRAVARNALPRCVAAGWLALLDRSRRAIASQGLIRSRSDLRWIFSGVGVGALLSASLGLVEFLLDSDLPLLALFREGMTRAGPVPRLTGSFEYANQTGMYLEAAVLPGPVAPGDTAILTVQVAAPPAPGTYRVHWDLIHQGVTSFRAATGQEFVSTLEVRLITPGKPAPVLPEEDAVIERVEQPERAPLAPWRATLWRIAAADFRERPLLGFGLDNYRLRYGRHLGWEEWNETVHTNNWYIETLVSVGLLGGVPFYAFLAILVVDIARRTPRAAGVEELAVGAALLAFMIHGVLDYFLLFHATGILFWILVGAWWCVTRIVPRQGRAKPTRTSYPKVLQ